MSRPPSLRAAKASASAEGRSSHWTSSTATTRGSVAANSRSAFSKPVAIARGSRLGPTGSARRSATSNASPLRSG